MRRSTSGSSVGSYSQGSTEPQTGDVDLGEDVATDIHNRAMDPGEKLVDFGEQKNKKSIGYELIPWTLVSKLIIGI